MRTLEQHQKPQKAAFRFVSDPQSNESLYSLVTRHHILSGNWSTRATLAELFGRTMSRVPYQPLPPQLAALSRQMPRGSPLSSFERIVLDHTSFPYHACFLSKERRDIALEVLKATGTAAAGLSMGLIAAPGSRAADSMAYCPECVHVDRQRLGHGLWRVSHQLPLVTVCHLHGCPLVVGCANCGNRVPTHFVLVLPDKTCGCGVFDPTYRSPRLSVSDRRWIASESHAAWQLGRRKPFDSILQDLTPYLWDAGFREGKRLDTARVVDSLRAQFGVALLRAVGCDEGDEQKPRWLTYLLRRDRRAPNTLRMLVLCQYLFGGVDGVDQERQAEPHGGQWKQKLKRLYAELSSTDEVAKALEKNPRTVKREAMRQGIAVVRKASKKSTDVPWDSIFERLNDGAPQRTIARELGISVEWVERALDERPELRVKREQEAQQARRDHHRRELETLISGNPGAGRRELRQLAMSSYCWLWKHDHEWLDFRIPPRDRFNPAKVSNKSRKDWPRIDAATAPQVAQAAAEVLAWPGSPPRLSETLLLSRLRLYSVYKLHREVMPLTREQLELHTESKSAFQRRRLGWAVEQVASQRSELAWHHIVAASGFGYRIIDMYKTLLIELIDKAGMAIKDSAVQ